MKLYAQHGYGKADKLDRGLEDGLLDGVIVSPHNERPEGFRECLQRLSGAEVRRDLLVDPQLYVSLIGNAREGNLPDYREYYVSNLTLRDFTPRKIERAVQGAIDFQRGLPVTRVVAPTILIDSFEDRAAQISHSLAQAAIDYHSTLSDPPLLLLSFLFNEVALSSHDAVAEFLDAVSLYKTAGFYLVVCREGNQYQQSFPASRMAEWLMMVYSLGTRNRFEVVCGYTDILGILAGAVGASSIATGWFNSLRQFELRRFLPKTGGRPAKERYSSAPLLNSIFFQELVNCFGAGRLGQVRSGTPYDRMFTTENAPDPDNWRPDQSTLHHWATLKSLFRIIDGGSIQERLTNLEQAIAAAEVLYAELRRRGIFFEPTTGPGHLREWSQALTIFRAEARV